AGAREAGGEAGAVGEAAHEGCWGGGPGEEGVGGAVRIAAGRGCGPREGRSWGPAAPSGAGQRCDMRWRRASAPAPARVTRLRVASSDPRLTPVRARSERSEPSAVVSSAVLSSTGVTAVLSS